MTTPRDYYEVLGVRRDASADDIRRAYRELARKLHPDVNKEADASTRFAEVQQAYDVLSDDDKKREYDQFGHAGVGAQTGGRGSGPFQWSSSAGGGRGGPHIDPGDFADVFEEMFGRSGGPFGGRGSTRTHARPQRGRDVDHTIQIAFMTAAVGGKETLRLRTGGGATPQEISVRIPPGIEHGAKLRVRGKGHAGVAGGKAGDLILTVEVGGHPWFRRDGLDLLIDVPISIAEAALGVTVSVPLMQGSVDLKIPPGTSSGTRLRIKEMGLTNSAGRTGDLYAVVQIAAPPQLSEDARKLVDQLGAMLPNPRQGAPWSDNED